jgi:iron(II)-dependent oxidoreductase
VDLKERIAEQLTGARERSLRLLAPLPEPELMRTPSALMSPPIWDLNHIGNYEEQWLLRNAFSANPIVPPSYDELFDPGVNPRRVRSQLDLPSPSASRAYVGDVRAQVVERLWRADLDADAPLTARGYVYGMVIQHEHQHDETLLQTISLRDTPYSLEAPAAPAAGIIEAPEVLVDTGVFLMGSTEPWAYDNERPGHRVSLSAFWIDTVPVTNRAFLAFIDAGGYDEPRWWSAAGWQHRRDENLVAPLFWRRDATGWSLRRFGRSIPMPLDEPVQHVSWYEADAYARWAGKRLPTEAEWEKAASWDPVSQRARRFPWGDAPDADRANLGQRHAGPSGVGAYPQGRSAFGAQQMLGDVWEWCASDFLPYPGFNAFPYPEYSAVHFGSDHKVLRGGSWATHASACRTTFRNWDYPIRRQIFAGFRCARDA